MMRTNTGYCSNLSTSRFVLPKELFDKLGYKETDLFSVKLIQDENADYPLVVKYELLERSDTDDVKGNLTNCVLCGYDTADISHTLMGKPICSDCVKKLGDAFKCKDKNKD